MLMIKILFISLFIYSLAAVTLSDELQPAVTHGPWEPKYEPEDKEN